jgi:hypothetical protein
MCVCVRVMCVCDVFACAVCATYVCVYSCGLARVYAHANSFHETKFTFTLHIRACSIMLADFRNFYFWQAMLTVVSQNVALVMLGVFISALKQHLILLQPSRKLLAITFVIFCTVWQKWAFTFAVHSGVFVPPFFGCFTHKQRHMRSQTNYQRATRLIRLALAACMCTRSFTCVVCMCVCVCVCGLVRLCVNVCVCAWTVSEIPQVLKICCSWSRPASA